MPVGPVEHNAAGAPLFDELQPDGEYGELIICGEEVCYLCLHNVSACKLVGAGVNAQGMPHIGNAAGTFIKTNIALAVYAAQGHGEQIAAAAVLRQQVCQGDVR